MLLINPVELGIVDRWQRALPLVPRPFAEMARLEGLSERELLEMLQRLIKAGVIARVGATLRPNTAGASTLAAMRVPSDRLEAVAALVNDEPGVNHNYEREHAFNLWFVVTGADWAAVRAAISRIEARAALPVFDLPLERSYYIDLGFPLVERTPGKRHAAKLGTADVQVSVSDKERRLLIGLQEGLMLVPRPYQALGHATGLSESDVIAHLCDLTGRTIITRLGLIVRHRELGFGANAMAVWDVEDAMIDHVGAEFACEPMVTLCYRRPRRLPVWPYNLFCMVHGRERTAVEREVNRLTVAAGLVDRPGAILFSGRRFKQRGASLTAA